MTIQFDDGPAIARGTTEYASEMLDGFPVAAKQICDRYDALDESIHYNRKTYEYSDMARGTATIEDCRLTAFGLPEMTRPATTSWSLTRITVICVNIGIILVAVGLLLRRGRRASAHRVRHGVRHEM